MKWTTETALDYLLSHGGKLDREGLNKAPVIVLPNPLGLKGSGCVDFFRKQHGAKLKQGKLTRLGSILHHVAGRFHAAA